MKYIYLLLILSAYCQAQVGINTKNPLHPLSVGSNTNENAVVVTADGQVGIGNSQPEALLDIKGKLKLTDGTQGTNKILTSDANGFATWGAVMSPSTDLKISVGVFGAGFNFTPANATTGLYTGATITLGPGKWLIRYALNLTPNSTISLDSWVTFPVTLTTVPGTVNTAFQSANITPDFRVNKRNFATYQGPSVGVSTNQKVLKSMGEFLLNNSSGAPITYYLVVEKPNRMSTSTPQSITLQNFASSIIRDNYLIGIPVNFN